MHRQVFVPTESSSFLPFLIPSEWYGKEVEFIVFPLENKSVKTKNKPKRYKSDNDNFVSLSASSLSKEWDSAADAEWDTLLTKMPPIK
jgi:hypothetical protein